MNRQPTPTYPYHHPHHGRPYIVVHDHDVLCGRGVNIAQHPGNERFRALVNTRQDEAYCTTFTTSEKRALAEEIINHIRSLDPPGRFLKRCGRSQSSRGLNGPWEELSHRECIKKTCQALRDCNRQDRHGYAAQVSVPNDVKESAEERTKSGLTLKEHAAAAVAKAHPSTLHSHHLNLNPPSLDHSPNGPTSMVAFAQGHGAHDDFSSNNSAALSSPSVEHPSEWLKTQHSDPMHIPSGAVPAPADPVLSTLSASIHSTPAPFVAPVPVSTTPNSQHNGNHSYSDHPLLSHHATSPQMPSPSSYHQEHQHDSAVSAPYSPVALLTPKRRDESDGEMDSPSPQDLDDAHLYDDHPCDYSSHHNDLQQFHDHPFNHHHTNHSSDEIQQSVSEAAVAFMHNSDHMSGLTLLGDDTLPHESLSISDL